MKKPKSINPHEPVQTKPLFEEVTDDMIAKWKEKHKAVKSVSVLVDYYDEDEEVPDDAERAQFIICRPSRPVSSMAGKAVNAGDLIKASNILVKNCVLAGDISLLTGSNTNDIVHDAIFEELNKTLTSRGVEAKKL